MSLRRASNLSDGSSVSNSKVNRIACNAIGRPISHESITEFETLFCQDRASLDAQLLMVIAVAAAFKVTPAQASSASSNKSLLQNSSDSPSPPAMVCRPAVLSACLIDNLQVDSAIWLNEKYARLNMLVHVKNRRFAWEACAKSAVVIVKKLLHVRSGRSSVLQMYRVIGY